MVKLLFCLFLILMLIIGKKRGLRTFIGLIFNFLVLMTTFYLVALGFNPVIVALFGCLIISRIILFYINGRSIKTEIAFISVCIVLIILSIIILTLSNKALLGGFGYEEFEEINMFSYDINLNMNNVLSAVMLIGLIGATVDTAVAVTSSLYEVYDNNPNLPVKSLFISGMNVGKDILATTANTLLFAYLGEFAALIIWFISMNNSIGYIINSKVFAAEFIKIMISGLGCIIIIPISAFLMSKKLDYNRRQK